VIHNQVSSPDALRDFFRAINLMVDDDFAVDLLESVCVSPEVLGPPNPELCFSGVPKLTFHHESHLRGVFKLMRGVHFQDTELLMSGFLDVKDLFDLPPCLARTADLVLALKLRSDGVSNYVTSLGKALDIDSLFLEALISLANRDASKLCLFAQRFGQCDDVVMANLQALVTSLEHFVPRYQTIPNSTLAPQTEPCGAAVHYKSGGLEYNEFVELLKHLNLPITANRALRIFSESEQGDGTLGPDGFEDAMVSLEQSVTTNVVNLMGYSFHTLVFWFVSSVALLVLLFSFIFLGVSAFSTGSAFEAVVNSVITIAVALAVDGGNDQEDGRRNNPEGFNFELERSVKRVFTMLKKAA
jgi:hypothetical protein